MMQLDFNFKILIKNIKIHYIYKFIFHNESNCCINLIYINKNKLRQVE